MRNIGLAEGVENKCSIHIVVLTRKHNIKSKSGPHGGIEIDRGLKTDEVPYLTDFETSWLKRKYDEAEIEEDRIAAHSILRRFSL